MSSLYRQVLRLSILVLIATSCTQPPTIDNPTPEATAAEETNGAVETRSETTPNSSTSLEQQREATYFTAKQAFARLVIYINKHREPLPELIWTVLPALRLLYFTETSGEYSEIIGGWVFDYEDAEGNPYEARINSWGEVSIQETQTDLSNAYPRAFQPDEWLLDNTDAHMLVLSLNGEGRGDGPGNMLMVQDVEGQGTRLVWNGWQISSVGLVMVDAQTGALYTPASTSLNEKSLVHQQDENDG